MTPTAPLTTAADALTPMSPKELEDLRSMMWLADVGHAPTMAVTMQRLLLNIDELTTYAAQIRRDTLNDAINIVRHDCSACQGSGLVDPETECEYCGRPMQAIRALPPGSPSSQTDTRPE